VTVFVGSTQLVIAWLIERMHDPLIAAWYHIGANVLSLIGIWLIGMRRAPQAAPQTA
jgi:hypothetical protein